MRPDAFDWFLTIVMVVCVTLALAGALFGAICMLIIAFKDGW